jgi:[CysO sulfur-carrier protein]-S-L-cysteine hydrolase
MLSSEGSSPLSTSFRLVLPQSIYDDMLAQARAELPNECCGILAGKIVTADTGALGRVEHRYPLVNALESPIEYSAHDRELLQIEKDKRAREIETLAIYHSHPTTDAVPSAKDRERWFQGENVICLIISLRTAAPEVRAWRLTAVSHWEAAWRIDAERRPGA